MTHPRHPHSHPHEHHHHGHDPSHFEQAARARWEQLTGSSGRWGWIGTLAVKLCAAQAAHVPQTRPRGALIFAADHGFTIPAGGGEASPGTRQRLIRLVHEGSAAGVLSRLYEASLRVIDVGIFGPETTIPGVIHRPVRPGTRDFTREPALTIAEVKQAMKTGSDAAGDALRDGVRLLILTGIGQGGATSAAALAAWLDTHPDATGDPPGQGRGPEESEILRAALERHRDSIRNPVSLLAGLGGLETAALAGAVLQAAAHNLPVLAGGPAAAAAAAVAARIDPRISGAVFVLPDAGALDPADRPRLGKIAPLPAWSGIPDETAAALLALPGFDAAAALFNGMTPGDPPE